MRRVQVFADEAGNFDFSLKQGATKWFILGSITTDDPSIGDRLLALRRELAWRGVALDSTFHATEDLQVVRDEVFRFLASENFRIDYTLMEKRKTMPHLQNTERFYKQTWFTHFKYVAKGIAHKADELLVVAAWIGTKKRRKAMRIALEDVVDQSAWWCKSYQAAFWPAESDPCLAGRGLRHVGRSAEVRAGRRSLVSADQQQDPHRVSPVRLGTTHYY